VKALRLAVLTFVGLPAAAAAQAPSLPIAYFSPQRAFFSSADGKAAQAKLTSLQAERSKEIDARNAAIKQLQAALQRTTAGLDAVTLRLREQEIERFSLDLQRYIEDAQAEFLGVQKELESAFLAKLTPALSLVVKDRGLMLVLNEDAGLIAWADPSLDITLEVVKRIQP
jgi:Skp family chaperone for outer membrane proteins